MHPKCTQLQLWCWRARLGACEHLTSAFSKCLVKAESQNLNRCSGDGTRGRGALPRLSAAEVLVNLATDTTVYLSRRGEALEVNESTFPSLLTGAVAMGREDEARDAMRAFERFGDAFGRYALEAWYSTLYDIYVYI